MKNLTQSDIYDIYQYLIGGYNQTFSQIKTQVSDFIKQRELEGISISSLKQQVFELKNYEQRELMSSGYYDY